MVMRQPFLPQGCFTAGGGGSAGVDGGFEGWLVGCVDGLWTLHIQCSFERYLPILLHLASWWQRAVQSCAEQRRDFSTWWDLMVDLHPSQLILVPCFGPGFTSTSPAMIRRKRESKAGAWPSLAKNTTVEMKVERLVVWKSRRKNEIELCV